MSTQGNNEQLLLDLFKKLNSDFFRENNSQLILENKGYLPFDYSIGWIPIENTSYRLKRVAYTLIDGEWYSRGNSEYEEKYYGDITTNSVNWYKNHKVVVIVEEMINSVFYTDDYGSDLVNHEVIHRKMLCFTHDIESMNQTHEDIFLNENLNKFRDITNYMFDNPEGE